MTKEWTWRRVKVFISHSRSEPNKTSRITLDEINKLTEEGWEVEKIKDYANEGFNDYATVWLSRERK